ncbi:hypothetical protein SAMN05216403_106116 [Nitrosospira multiformis ATCC 25196]|uniref:Uncharacterized protein n=1 Tax=Nitrosospira multiformis (strain ATCC 25196 / NCIMB 11849 / C 71) TaxID=323848 RepID=A0A1H5U793_NITMU|nr:hypothetical protein SAMN05216403_106116 [Nitrosospira multiformis ATCC 25196]
MDVVDGAVSEDSQGKVAQPDGLLDGIACHAVFSDQLSALVSLNS